MDFGNGFRKWISEMDFGNGLRKWISAMDFGNGFREWVAEMDFSEWITDPFFRGILDSNVHRQKLP